MHDTIAALRSLQELDQDIYRLKQELKRLPEERARKRAAIDALNARAHEQTLKGRELRGKIKEIEDQTTRERQRIRKVENEASSSRADVALLAAYQHEIKTLKRDISGAEEQGLALVEQAENVENELARVKAEIAESEQVFAAFNQNVEQEMSIAQKKLDHLLEQRKQRLRAGISPESLSLYERLLVAREGLALAELDGRICQVCFMEVPTNLYVRVARAMQLTQCPSCDRIFFQRIS